MKAESVLFTLIISIVVRSKCTAEECVKLSSCSCRFTNGSVVDLSWIASHGTEPKFKDVDSTNDSYKYSFNPCYAFEEGSCKENTAACQFDGKQSYYKIGEQDQVSFTIDGNRLVATYQSLLRKTAVTLVCHKGSNEVKLVVFGETTPGSMIYNMTLYSKCACPDECVSKTPSKEGLSTGSILVIFFVVMLCCYLFGGIIFQKIVKGAEGRELVPHYEFWIDFPLLVRDGVVYVLNGCKTEASYERI